MIDIIGLPTLKRLETLCDHQCTLSYFRWIEQKEYVSWIKRIGWNHSCRLCKSEPGIGWYRAIFSLLLFAEKVTQSHRKTNTSRFPVGSLMLLLHYCGFSNRKSIAGIWFIKLHKFLSLYLFYEA